MQKSTERIFLGWDRPVVEAVADHLLSGLNPPFFNLSGTVVLVPTRQAARRLRATLAARSAERGGAVGGLEVVTPSWLLRLGVPELPEADSITTSAVITSMLGRLGPENFPALFAACPEEPSPEWLRGAASVVQRTRSALADGGLSVRDVVDRFSGDLQELDRWQDLARLEAGVSSAFTGLGFSDACLNQTRLPDTVSLPAGTACVVLAGLPDPSPLVVKILTGLASRVQVRVLIHAPEELQDSFDDWGRPDMEIWCRRELDIPDEERNLISTRDPEDQARKVLVCMAREAAQPLGANGKPPAPGDFAIAIPDREISAPLLSALAAAGIPAHDPAPVPFVRSRLGRLLSGLVRLLARDEYQVLHELLRHPDFLRWITTGMDKTPAQLLEAFDEVQNRFLPFTARLMHERAGSVGASDPGCALVFQALEKMLGWAAKCAGPQLFEQLGAWLSAIYAGCRLDPRDPETTGFVSASEQLEQVFREVSACASRFPEISDSGLLALFSARLNALSLVPVREGAVLDLDGWLEMAWNNAPIAIVTGLNEGSLPEAVPADALLTVSLREKLGLYSDPQRLARDAFLLAGIIASRRKCGRTILITGRTGMGGDPRKPSRLLFRVSDEKLAGRVRDLFENQEEPGRPPAAEESVRLDFRCPDDLPEGKKRPERFSASRFNEYLACPFRYYLKRVLDMEELADQKREPDMLDFGLLVHHAFQRFGENPRNRALSDAAMIERDLHDGAREWVHARFGGRPSLTVRLALSTALERLSAAARTQARLAEEGWEICHVEYAPAEPVAVGTFRLWGKVDRIDRNTQTGQWRIIDYKTSDKVVTPIEAHLAKRSQSAMEQVPDHARVEAEGFCGEWLNLQLPLYVPLAREVIGSAEPELAYFNLPKAIGDTGLYVWAGFSEELLALAVESAGKMSGLIRAGIFWPPNRRKSPYENPLDRVLPAPLEELLTPECVTALSEGWAR